ASALADGEWRYVVLDTEVVLRVIQERDQPAALRGAGDTLLGERFARPTGAHVGRLRGDLVLVHAVPPVQRSNADVAVDYALVIVNDLAAVGQRERAPALEVGIGREAEDLGLAATRIVLLDEGGKVVLIPAVLRRGLNHVG